MWKSRYRVKIHTIAHFTFRLNGGRQRRAEIAKEGEKIVVEKIVMVALIFWVVLSVVLLPVVVWQAHSLKEENVTLHQQLVEARTNAGKPIVITDLPLGEYERVDLPNPTSAFCWQKGYMGKDQLTGVMGNGKEIPKHFSVVEKLFGWEKVPRKVMVED